MPEHLESLLVPFCFRQRHWLHAKQTLLDSNLLLGCEWSWVEKMAAFSLSLMTDDTVGCRWAETV